MASRETWWFAAWGWTGLTRPGTGRTPAAEDAGRRGEVESLPKAGRALTEEGAGLDRGTASDTRASGRKAEVQPSAVVCSAKRSPLVLGLLGAGRAGRPVHGGDPMLGTRLSRPLTLLAAGALAVGVIATI